MANSDPVRKRIWTWLAIHGKSHLLSCIYTKQKPAAALWHGKHKADPCLKYKWINKHWGTDARRQEKCLADRLRRNMWSRACPRCTQAQVAASFPLFMYFRCCSPRYRHPQVKGSAEFSALHVLIHLLLPPPRFKGSLQVRAWSVISSLYSGAVHTSASFRSNSKRGNGKTWVIKPPVSFQAPRDESDATKSDFLSFIWYSTDELVRLKKKIFFNLTSRSGMSLFAQPH